ncbi:MAG: nuclear transport factor 2 family protein, partial [Cyanobacteria bacterium J06638_22]
DLELHRTGGTKFHELVPKELEIRVRGDRVVLVVAKVFLSGSFLGNAFAGDHRYLRVWQNGENGWQIVGGSVVPIP